MDTTTQRLTDALRHITETARTGSTNVRASDLRRTLADVAALGERALAPTDPTPLELRTALHALAYAPAVRQAIGTSHTGDCGCPYCVAMGLLR